MEGVLFLQYRIRPEQEGEKMKINQVEELIGISKKNIRFYEEQNLIRPERNPENGYREYTVSDVEQLRRVKLLRQLDVPCERIRELMEGKISLPQCMEEQETRLKNRQKDLERMQELCGMLTSSKEEYPTLHAEPYLETMRKMEKGGTQFMNVEKTDVSKRKTGAVVAAAVTIIVMLALIALVIWGNTQDPLPTAVLIFVILIPACMIIGTVIALFQRIKELKGGEIDEARKY